MARLYASVSGDDGKDATRQGRHTISGHVCGWDVGVGVFGHIVEGRDVFEVRATRGSNGSSGGTVIGEVMLDAEGDPVFVPSAE